jgi:hypothetical protein
MILHILKKDLRQLSLLASLVALAQIANAAAWFALGNFEEPRGLVVVAYLFSGATFIGIAAVIASVVHLDPLPGVSQDWLIRPVRRTDLLAAKVLFVVIVVHGPMLLADLAHAAAAGFTVREALGAAVSRALYLFLIFDIPVLALATMTRTLVQVGAWALAIWVAVLAGILGGVLVRGGGPPVFAGSGLQWMTPAYWSALALTAGIAVALLQFYRRSTRRAHLIAMGAVLLAPTLSFSGWAPVFAVQRSLSRDSTAAGPTMIVFDPAIGRSGADAPATSTVTVLLPVRVLGLPEDSLLLSDRTDVRIADDDGTTLYQGKTSPNLGYGDDLSVGIATAGDASTHQRIVLPARVYEHVRGRAIRLELDYSLTLLRVEAETTLSGMDGNDRSTLFGWCKTKLDEDADDVELGCVRPAHSPSCVMATLTNPTTGKRNPENVFCAPDYTPFQVQLIPGVMSRFGGAMPFRDTKGLAKYPVDGSQLGAAQVALRAYRPLAHFTRRLDVPSLRLEDWATGVASAR